MCIVQSRYILKIVAKLIAVRIRALGTVEQMENDLMF